MIISNLSVPMLGLVDTAILGHLENPAFLAAVAVGSSILSFLYWGFGFLRMGTTGFAAQAHGSQQHNRSRLIVAQSMILGLALGASIVCLSPVLLGLGLQLIVPPTGSGELAASYAQIRIFSAPAVLMNYAIIGWMIGHQNTRWPLIITLFTNILNLMLDFLLIIGLDMNSDGAAIATLIAEYSGCGLALYLLKRQLHGLPGSLDVHSLWRWRDYRELFIVNRHLFVRTLALLASFAFFTAQGAKQGDIVLAANVILINLLTLTAFGMDGFAHAAEALIGDAVGKRNNKLFLAICYHCAFWSLLTALGFTLLFLVAGPELVGLLTSIPTVKAAVIQYFPWLLVLPLVSVWSYLFDGIFIGATQTAAMQTTMLYAVTLVYLPIWYFGQHWGNHGLWIALIAFNAARGLFLGICFYRFNQQQRWWQTTINNC
jgi:MATE family multidrug resistance protein